MENIIQKLISLSNSSKQVVLYQSDVKTIMKGIGKIMGKFDTELLEFLIFTNVASIFDYCFMGFKNTKLRVDIDKNALETWAANNRVVGHFMPFMITSTGDNFGYLMDIVDDKGRHPVAYYSNEHTDDIVVIGSSFKAFMKTFLTDVEDTLNTSGEDFIIEINKSGWPVNIEHWLANDEILRANQAAIHIAMKTHMPDTNFH